MHLLQTASGRDPAGPSSIEELDSELIAALLNEDMDDSEASRRTSTPKPGDDVLGTY